MKRVSTLEKENQQLRHQLQQAEAIIEVQKKISEILHGAPESKDGNKP
jgi:cell shape-determining protein MreC